VPSRRKRARDDHAGRDATPPRQAPSRRTPPVELVPPAESQELHELPPHRILIPAEPPPAAPRRASKRHQHPLSSVLGKKTARKEPPSAALGAPPKEPPLAVLGAPPKPTESTSAKVPATEERTARDESSTRGRERAERPIAVTVPRVPTALEKPDEDLYAIVRQHLEMSCSSGESDPEEPTLVIEAGPPRLVGRRAGQRPWRQQPTPSQTPSAASL